MTVVGRSARAASTIAALGTVSSLGTQNNLALADHVHVGLQSVGLSGHTTGVSMASAASVTIVAGSNVTLSGATAAGGMSATMTLATPVAAIPMPTSSSSYFVGPPLAYGGNGLFTSNSGNGNMFIYPFSVSLQVPVSAINPFYVSRSSIVSTNTTLGRSETLSYGFGIYSADFAGSRYVLLASAMRSLTMQATGSTGAADYGDGIRTVSQTLNTPITLSSSVIYALAVFVHNPGAGGAAGQGGLMYIESANARHMGPWGSAGQPATAIAGSVPFFRDAPGDKYQTTVVMSTFPAFITWNSSFLVFSSTITNRPPVGLRG